MISGSVIYHYQEHRWEIWMYIFLEFFSSLYMQICKLGQKLRFFLHFYPKIPFVIRFWFLFVHSIILDTLIFKTLKKLFQSTAQRPSSKHLKFVYIWKRLTAHTHVYKHVHFHGNTSVPWPACGLCFSLWDAMTQLVLVR